MFVVSLHASAMSCRRLLLWFAIALAICCFSAPAWYFFMFWSHVYGTFEWCVDGFCFIVSFEQHVNVTGCVRLLAF